MSGSEALTQRLIWATRGRSWGFRFLLDGGLPDPLAAYERSFSTLADTPTAHGRVGSEVGVRFPDPLGRRDASGRVIPHEFVVFGAPADEVTSVDDGVARLWPLVAEAYAAVWDAERPPTESDLRLP